MRLPGRDRHQTLPHVRRWLRFIKSHQNLGGPFPPKFGGPKTSKFRRDFEQLHVLIANISRLQQYIVKRKTALQTTGTPAQANLIRYTLVHKRRKIGPEFWPTQWAAITLIQFWHCHACSNLLFRIISVSGLSLGTAAEVLCLIYEIQRTVQ